MRSWIVLFGLLLPCVAHAETSASSLLAQYDAASRADKDLFELVIASVENGIMWSQAHLKREKSICPPDNLSLDKAQVMRILRDGVKREPVWADKPYGLVLFRSLQAVFPCK